MATNDFTPFAVGSGANVITQAAYVALTSLTQNGFQSGIAQSNQLNKVWRQSSIMSAVLGQFIANTTGQNATDDGTTATLLTNLIAAVNANSPSLVGSVRNLSMSVTAASASATLTADEIVVGSTLGGLKYVLPSFSKTINLATTGAGGMDTGSAPASGFVALYAIFNPGTNTAALLATNATSASAGSIYSAGNMPAGYTASALVSVWPTNGSGQFIVGYQADRGIFYTVVSVLNNSTSQASFSSLSISSAVPKNAKSCSGYASASNTSASTTIITLATTSGGVAALQVVDASSGSAAAVGTSGAFSLPISSGQLIFYTATTTGGTPTYTVAISGYTI